MAQNIPGRSWLVQGAALKREWSTCAWRAFFFAMLFVGAPLFSDRAIAQSSNGSRSGARSTTAATRDNEREAGKCVIRSNIDVATPILLRFGPDAPPFATLLRGPVELTLPAPGAVRGARVTTTQSGIFLEGMSAFEDLEFHPTAPLVLNRFLVLSSDARVRIAAAGRAGFDVRYDLPADDQVDVAPLHPLRATASCEDLTLDGPGFDLVVEDATRGVLRGDRKVPLAADDGGSTVATVRAASNLAVDVLERSPRSTRIMIRRTTSSVVGWVPNWALDFDPTAVALGSVGTLGHGAGTGIGEGFTQRTFRCTHPVLLVAEQRSERNTVGVIAADTVVDLGKPQADAFEVRLRTSAIAIAKGSRFVVARADIRDCRVRDPFAPLLRARRAAVWPTAPVRSTEAPPASDAERTRPK